MMSSEPRPLLGKTRPSSPALGRVALDPLSASCGALMATALPGGYRHTRYPAPPELCEWVQHFWYESWCFRPGTEHPREMLPHPSVHLVFSNGNARIYGVQRGRFTRKLCGRGRIFGIRFWPGAFYPFLSTPVSSLTDRMVAAERVLTGTVALAADILNCKSEHSMVRSAVRYLLEHRPRTDSKVSLAKRAVQEIACDPGLTRVRDLATRTSSSERTVQRLFRRYVGVSACWAIKRYRTYEALAQLPVAPVGDLADLAQRLGYFDQAHFNRDFKLRVGRAPSAYRASIRDT
jgi:AraC-like DNA-binding protein